MKKYLVSILVITLAFVVIFTFELTPHVKSAKSIKREISSLEQDAKYYTDVFLMPEGTYDELINIEKEKYRDEIFSVIRILTMLLFLIAIDGISVTFMFLHNLDYKENIAARKTARQEKKRAALQEKQKSIQDELDRMK